MLPIDQRLTRGESVCYRACPHWIALVFPFAVAAAFGAPGALLIVFSVAFGMENVALESAFVIGLVLQVAACAVVLALLCWATADFAVTNRRVVLKPSCLTSAVWQKCFCLRLRQLRSNRASWERCWITAPLW